MDFKETITCARGRYFHKEHARATGGQRPGSPVPPQLRRRCRQGLAGAQGGAGGGGGEGEGAPSARAIEISRQL